MAHISAPKKGGKRNAAAPIELYSHQRVRPFLLFNHNNNSNKNIKETSKQLTAGGDFTGGGPSFFPSQSCVEDAEFQQQPHGSCVRAHPCVPSLYSLFFSFLLLLVVAAAVAPAQPLLFWRFGIRNTAGRNRPNGGGRRNRKTNSRPTSTLRGKTSENESNRLGRRRVSKIFKYSNELVGPKWRDISNFV